MRVYEGGGKMRVYKGGYYQGDLGINSCYYTAGHRHWRAML